jgi:acetyltransferase-like isoleucine patch superfamily enzyme
MSFPGDIATAEWLKQFGHSYLTIDCGAWTYGRPQIRAAKHDFPRLLKIGRYCSIAPEVIIFIGRDGRHPTDTLTTYPIGMSVSPEIRKHDPAKDIPFDRRESRSLDKNLDVIIQDDVWIGLRSVIMSGITIGQGAIVAAGAIVTKDVAPYSIVGGVPAKHMHFRHTAEVIEQIIASQWWLKDPDELWAQAGSHLLSANVTDLLKLLHQ